jgi:hypothetical protein
MISIVAGTVWVQIGQCADPLMPFSTIGFIAFFPLTTSDAKTRSEVVAFYNFFQNPSPTPTASPGDRKLAIYVTMSI